MAHYTNRDGPGCARLVRVGEERVLYPSGNLLRREVLMVSRQLCPSKPPINQSNIPTKANRHTLDYQ